MLPSPRGLHGRHGLADFYNLCSSPWLPPAPLASLLLPKLSKFLLNQYLPGRFVLAVPSTWDTSPALHEAAQHLVLNPSVTLRRCLP